MAGWSSTALLFMVLVIPGSIPLLKAQRGTEPAQGVEPTLRVEPDRAVRGGMVTVTGEDHDCASEISIHFEGEVVAEVPARGSSRVEIVIPSGAAPFANEVSSWCLPSSFDDVGIEEQAQAVVYVMRPELYVCAPGCSDPATGMPGDEVVLGTVEPLCATVTIAWDSVPIAGFDDERYEVETVIAVPIDATAGTHTVSASCSSGPVFASVPFEVTAPPTTSSSTSSTSTSISTSSTTTSSTTTSSTTTLTTPITAPPNPG